MCETIVFTSGKGGVGKTTTVANIGVGLSLLDKKVIMLDMDMGLRNLDVVMGLEDRIQYNLLDLLKNECRLKQAIIKDKRFPNLYMIPASLNYTNLMKHTKSLQILINNLEKEFDYCLIDCPAGIDYGFSFAISAAKKAIIVSTPHITAVRDAGRVAAILKGNHFPHLNLILNQYNHKMVRHHDMLSVSDIEEILDLDCIGTIPNDNKIIISQNKGQPIISMHSRATRHYNKIIDILVSNETVQETCVLQNKIMLKECRNES